MENNRKTNYYNSRNKRRVTAYLKPSVNHFFNNYVSSNEVSDSYAINIIIKDFFAKLSEEQKRYYSNFSNKPKQ